MSKITVITDAKGQIQAIGHGHLSEATSRKPGAKGLQGGLRPLPDQRIHELEIPHDATQIKEWKELVEKVRPHLKATA
jgi:hypothetical protein